MNVTPNIAMIYIYIYKKDSWHFILRGMSYLRSHHLVLWSLETLTDFQTEGTGYARGNILSPLKRSTLDMLHC
jgi:hypothetical protein